MIDTDFQIMISSGDEGKGRNVRGEGVGLFVTFYFFFEKL